MDGARRGERPRGGCTLATVTYAAFEALARALKNQFRDLDVVDSESVRDDFGDAYVIRLFLKDRRLLALKFHGMVVHGSSPHRLVDMVHYECRRALQAAYRRCVEHSDCRAVPELGAACYEESFGPA